MPRKVPTSAAATLCPISSGWHSSYQLSWVAYPVYIHFFFSGLSFQSTGAGHYLHRPITAARYIYRNMRALGNRPEYKKIWCVYCRWCNKTDRKLNSRPIKKTWSWTGCTLRLRYRCRDRFHKRPPCKDKGTRRGCICMAMNLHLAGDKKFI